ncbi:hypothetical protein Acor_66640 [Acrocarpospora corrugata]|uniref:DUF3427 domain-containing protein n=1 Tax=Acrocarpospora corrugata TaxID=35763 RepID=A0A5M3W724_9ACTN|nr:hypothetical protein Acor_66640 [Acrocarpospora corrugata]
MDFIGNQHRRFRFDRRYRALTGASRTGVARDVEAGFPLLPAGCHIDLDREVARLVLANIRQTLQLRWADLAAELAALPEPTTLAAFLEETGLEVGDLYRRRKGWSELRRAAGRGKAAGPDDKKLGQAFGRMLHTDDAERLDFVRHIVDGGALRGVRHHRLLAMLDATLWGGTNPASTAEARLADLLRHPDRVSELRELSALLADGRRRVTLPLSGDIPLHVHATYSKNEALAAFGVDKPGHMREGVKWVPEAQADLFFVTIDKSTGHYSPTTMYHDRAITRESFQWESQSTLRQVNPTAQRYRSGRSSVHLFMREHKRDEGLGAPPYTYAGPMSFDHCDGDRPVRFRWRLEHALPAEVFHYAKVTAG